MTFETDPKIVAWAEKRIAELEPLVDRMVYLVSGSKFWGWLMGPNYRWYRHQLQICVEFQKLLEQNELLRERLSELGLDADVELNRMLFARDDIGTPRIFNTKSLWKVR